MEEIGCLKIGQDFLLFVAIDFSLFKPPRKWVKEERKGKNKQFRWWRSLFPHYFFPFLSEFINKHSSFSLTLDTLRENAFHFHLPQHNVFRFLSVNHVSHTELSSSERRDTMMGGNFHFIIVLCSTQLMLLLYGENFTLTIEFFSSFPTFECSRCSWMLKIRTPATFFLFFLTVAVEFFISNRKFFSLRAK